MLSSVAAAIGTQGPQMVLSLLFVVSLLLPPLIWFLLPLELLPLLVLVLVLAAGLRYPQSPPP